MRQRRRGRGHQPFQDLRLPLRNRQYFDRLGSKIVCTTDNPVILPPGRARLATCPVPTGSACVAKTMGIVVVACRAAPTSVEEVPKINSTFERTNSAASLRS